MTRNPLLGRRPTRALLLAPLLAALIAAVAILTPPHAERALAAKTASWVRYDTTIDLHPDGTFTVTEDQSIHFSGGTFSEGYAVIPLDRVENITNIQVSDDGQAYRRALSEGTPGTFTASLTGGQIEILWWFKQAFNETRHFTIRYDVVGGLKVYPATGKEQLWWRPIDEDFAGDIQDATVTINLPQAVPQDQLSLAYYRRGDFPVEYEVVSPTQVRFTASNISQGNALEARLEFPRMTSATVPNWQAADDKRLAEKERLDKYGALVNAIMLGVGLLLLVGGPIAVVLAWFTRGRDAPVALPIDLLKEPPDDLPPGAVGTLLDEKADDHDVIATIVSLGERGAIQIEETQRAGILGIGSTRDFIFRHLHDTQVTPQPAQPVSPQPAADPGAAQPPTDQPTIQPAGEPVATPLMKFEQELLTTIFGHNGKAEVKLSDIKPRFTERQGRIKEAMYDELVSRGYFPRNPQSVRRTWRTIGTTLAVLAVFGGCVLLGLLGSFAPLVIVPVIAIVVIAVAIAIVAGVMPRKTAKGAEAAAKWNAFRRYLAEIERYENVAEAKEVFNRYLAYAVAFGLERSWVSKFASVDAPSPNWYGPYGSGGWSGAGRHGPGGTVIIPGGGRMGDSDGGPHLPDFPDLDDVQRGSDRAGRGLQHSSDSLFDLFNEAAKAFTAFGGGGGRGGRGGGFGGFSGGGRSFGGGGGGGSRGFR